MADNEVKKLQVTGSLRGPAGSDGKSAYEYAQDGGYTGTEEEFAIKLASDSSAFYITVSGDSENGYTLDKTGAEIEAAYTAGKRMYCKFPNDFHDEGDIPLNYRRVYRNPYTEEHEVDNFIYNFVHVNGYIFTEIKFGISASSYEIYIVNFDRRTLASQSAVDAVKVKPSDAVLYVNFTLSDDSVTSELPASGIEYYFMQGFAIYAILGEFVIPFRGVLDGVCQFFGPIAGGQANVLLNVIDNQAEMEFEFNDPVTSVNGETGDVTINIPTVPTALKNPNALTINGTTYDGSAAVDMTEKINALIDAKLGVIENGSY